MDAKTWQRISAGKPKTSLSYVDLQVLVAPRRDRRLYVVGDALADVYLLRASGSVERHFFLPWAFKGIGENQEYLDWEVETTRKRLMETSAAHPYLRQALHDATKPPKQRKAALHVANFILAGAFAKDNDLILTTYAGAEPANALLWLADNGQTSRCFLLGDLGEKRAAADPGDKVFAYPRAAVTSDRLWLLSPRGYFLWEELESFWQEAQKKEKKPKP
jgi:hypothetical protein